MINPYSYIDDLEVHVAARFGAKYAIATDCCTHAIDLAARFRKLAGLKDMNGHRVEPVRVWVPKHTYVSVPLYLKRIGYEVRFSDLVWEQYYEIAPLHIIDAARGWRCANTLSSLIRREYTVCLSFQTKKHVSAGRGGMILTNDQPLAEWCVRARHDGRGGSASHSVNQDGFHYYMEPQKAAWILTFLQAHPEGIDMEMEKYPDVSQFPFFKETL